jgi:hypothetical protein
MHNESQNEVWLRLADYASKYRVSISTLRRKIKNGSIEYKFCDGKYLIFDEAMGRDETVNNILGASEERLQERDEMRTSEEPILSSANQLLSELKRAYMSILHEKEEQIIQLKEEVTDLKTLVRVLEEDNERLRRLGTRTQITHF